MNSISNWKIFSNKMIIIKMNMIILINIVVIIILKMNLMMMIILKKNLSIHSKYSSVRSTIQSLMTSSSEFIAEQWSFSKSKTLWWFECTVWLLNKKWLKSQLKMRIIKTIFLKIQWWWQIFHNLTLFQWYLKCSTSHNTGHLKLKIKNTYVTTWIWLFECWKSLILY